MELSKTNNGAQNIFGFYKLQQPYHHNSDLFQIEEEMNLINFTRVTKF